jgi:hypothetical protein
MILRHSFRLFFKKGTNKYAFSLDNGQPPNLPPFKPEDHGISPDFIMTNFTKMKGWGCKVPQNKLLGYLSKLPKPVGI